jgi:hypothetical protein
LPALQLVGHATHDVGMRGGDVLGFLGIGEEVEELRALTAFVAARFAKEEFVAVVRPRGIAAEVGGLGDRVFVVLKENIRLLRRRCGAARDVLGQPAAVFVLAL